MGSRLRGVSSLLTGVLLDSRSVLTTSLQPLYLEVISLRLLVLCACCQTLQLLLKLGQDLITSLTSCMPSELSFIGMLEKEWKKASSLKLEKILLLLRRIMKRGEKNTKWNLQELFAKRNLLCINTLTLSNS